MIRPLGGGRGVAAYLTLLGELDVRIVRDKVDKILKNHQSII